MSEINELNDYVISEDELMDVAGGKEKETKIVVCQACGVAYKVPKSRKINGEFVCKKCK